MILYEVHEILLTRFFPRTKSSLTKDLVYLIRSHNLFKPIVSTYCKVTKKVKPTNIFLASRRRHGLMSYLDKPLPKHDKTMKLYFSFLNFSSFFCIALMIFLNGMYEEKKSIISQFMPIFPLITSDF